MCGKQHSKTYTHFTFSTIISSGSLPLNGVHPGFVVASLADEIPCRSQLFLHSPLSPPLQRSRRVWYKVLKQAGYFPILHFLDSQAFLLFAAKKSPGWNTSMRCCASYPSWARRLAAPHHSLGTLNQAASLLPTPACPASPEGFSPSQASPRPCQGAA